MSCGGSGGGGGGCSPGATGGLEQPSRRCETGERPGDQPRASKATGWEANAALGRPQAVHSGDQESAADSEFCTSVQAQAAALGGRAANQPARPRAPTPLRLLDVASTSLPMRDQVPWKHAPRSSFIHGPAAGPCLARVFGRLLASYKAISMPWGIHRRALLAAQTLLGRPAARAPAAALSSSSGSDAVSGRLRELGDAMVRLPPPLPPPPPPPLLAASCQLALSFANAQADAVAAAETVGPSANALLLETDPAARGPREQCATGSTGACTLQWFHCNDCVHVRRMPPLFTACCASGSESHPPPA